MPVVNDLKIATTVKFTSDIIKRVTGMTFLYDPNWTPQQIGYPGDSLPFAFFEIVKIQEIQHNEVSNRRILLYEETPDNQQAKYGMLRQSVLQVVSDNVAVDPIQYKMEVLIPYGFITKLFGTVGDAMVAVFSFFDSDMASTARSITGSLKMMVDYADKFLQTVNVFYPTVSAAYNKNSIMAMARNRSVLKMKSWDSWDYKYVIIKDVSISKDGLEDNYFRASIDVQEVPVLTLGKASGTSGKSSETFREKAGQVLKKNFDAVLDISRDSV